MKIEENQLYKTEEVADFLRVSQITVKRYIAEDRIPSIKFNGLRRIKGSDLLKSISQQKGNGHFYKGQKNRVHVENKK